ncbi:hypothetical protein B566_EDAN019162, partial [Ephemera danica]
MALMDFIKKQFIDILEWQEAGDGTLAWRFPMAGNEIQNGASLTVRESQLAMFVNEGKTADAHALACAAVAAALGAAFIGADTLTTWAEDRFYGEPVVLRESSPYQRVVLTSGPAGIRLYLNGNLQFHSRDEYRYHEALVHPALAAHGAPRRVLVLGGGDGLAVREILKHPGVQEVVLVELDPRMTRLFSTQPLLTALNANALNSPKVSVVNADAFTWVEQGQDTVFVIAACGLVYELAAGALASYLLGDSVLQFSTIIGTYLFAMGLGSFFSRYFERQLIAHFLRIELLVGFVGGLMPLALFTAHSLLPGSAALPFRVLLYALVLLVGLL